MENSDGYVFNLTLRLGAAARVDSTYVHPERSDFIPGTSCGIDPQTDAVVPAVLSAVALTSGFDTPLSYQLTVPGDEATTSRIEYEGPTACGTGQFRGNWSGSGTLFAQGYGPPDFAFFIIIRDYFTPAYPDGAVDWLASLSLHAGSTSSQYGTPLQFYPAPESGGLSEAGLPLG